MKYVLEVDVDDTDDGHVIKSIAVPTMLGLSVGEQYELTAMLLLQALRFVVNKRVRVRSKATGKQKTKQQFLQDVNIICSNILQQAGIQSPTDLSVVDRKLAPLLPDFVVHEQKSLKDVEAMDNSTFYRAFAAYLIHILKEEQHG